jgi:hypothetical protein
VFFTTILKIRRNPHLLESRFFLAFPIAKPGGARASQDFDLLSPVVILGLRQSDRDLPQVLDVLSRTAQIAGPSRAHGAREVR